MAPTLEQAFSRKIWMAVTAILENLMFGAVLLGWSSLLLMLKNEGFYSNLCVAKEKPNSIYHNSTASYASSELGTVENTLQPKSTYESDEVIIYTKSGYPSCVEQDETLNRYFAIGSSLLSAVVMVLGIIMDKYGPRIIRLSGSLTFAISCVLFAVGTMDTKNLSILILPAVLLNGMGGISYAFTSFSVANLFGNRQSTMISLMMGSYCGSAVFYMLLKVFYDAGIPFEAIMLFHGGIALLTFLNCFFNVPSGNIPSPQESSSSSISNGQPQPPPQSFWKVLLTPCVLLSLVTVCLTQLRLISYMGWLELSLKWSAKELGFEEEKTRDTVSFYTFLFGLFQINCFFMSPVVGILLDWKVTSRYNNGRKMKQRIMNLSRAFTITNVFLTLFDIILLFDTILPLQENKCIEFQSVCLVASALFCNILHPVAFILHTAVRTFLRSSVGSLYACMYLSTYFGKLIGLESIVGALFALLQDPLFVCINSKFGGDPFWVNVGLLVATMLCFALPLYLWLYSRLEMQPIEQGVREQELEIMPNREHEEGIALHQHAWNE